MTQKRSTDFTVVHPVWAGLNSIIAKALPPLLVVATVGVTGGAFATYTAVNKLLTNQEEHGAKIKQLQETYAVMERIAVKTSKNEDDINFLKTEVLNLRTELKIVEANAIRRDQILELIKRVEQQLEIALLRSGVKVPPRMMSSEFQK